MKDHRTGPTKCVNCGHQMDAAFGPFSDHAPKPGDFSICIRCRHLMVFGPKLKLREPTADERLEAAGDQEIVQTMNLLSKVAK
jgi:hypothetical protein